MLAYPFFCHCFCCQNLYLSYTKDQVPISTNSIVEGYNSVKRNVRECNVALALKPLVTGMQFRHQDHLDDANYKKDAILPPGLKNSNNYKEAKERARQCIGGVRFVDGKSKQRATVTGVSGKTYNVNLSTFSCDCCRERVNCGHLTASANKKHGGNDAIDQYYPDELKMSRYLEDIRIMGNFPVYPSDESIEAHRNLYDYKLRLPVAIRRKKGRPKKNRRAKTWKDGGNNRKEQKPNRSISKIHSSVK